jgi:hypothetical protein
VTLVAGLIALVLGVGLAVVGSGGVWLQSRRDAAGFVTTNPQLLASSTAAITAEDIDLRLDDGTPRWVRSDRFGTVRLRATGQGNGAVFIGIAPRAALDRWLASTAHDEVSDLAGGEATYRRHGGQATLTSPSQQTFWSSSATGTGTQELRWPVQSGEWGIVVSRPDGAPGVRATVDLGASVPGLRGLALGLLVAGVVLLVGGAVLVIVAAVGLGRSTGRSGSAGQPAAPVPLPPSPRTAMEDDSATTTQQPSVGGDVRRH